MASTVAESATITVPADYLEDVRSAFIAELEDDAEALRTNQNDLVTERGCREDRDASWRLLSWDLRGLDQVLAADKDTEIVVERETLFHALETLCRLLTDRLMDQMSYAPVDMGAVLELTSRLRWAAREAARALPSEAGKRTFPVDRDTRDMLHRLAMWNADDFEFDHALKDGEQQTVIRLRGKLDFITALLDDLGWKAEVTEERTYVITVNPEPLAAWLDEQRNDLRQAILDNRADLGHQEAGDQGYYYCGKSQAESIASSRDRIDRYEADVALMSDLLDRLAPAEAVA